MNGWDQAREAVERHAAAGGIFVKLTNDGDKVSGVFIGDPHVREVVWTGERYELFDEDNPKHKRKRPTLRLATNFYVPAENAMKVIEFNATATKDVLKLRDKYGFRDWTFEVERQGGPNDPKTRFRILVAHRRELITQAYRRIVQMGVAEDCVGIVMGQDHRRRPGAPVQVASIDTLRHRAKPLADIVFRDEAHRALSRSDRDLAAHYPRAIHIGLTATPYRSDGRGLGEAYDVIIVVAQPRELIADGFLVAPRVFTVPAGSLPNLAGVLRHQQR
jgi:hypothetical protein